MARRQITNQGNQRCGGHKGRSKGYPRVHSMVSMVIVGTKLPTRAIRGAAGPSKGRPKGHPRVHSMVNMVRETEGVPIKNKE